MRNPLASKLANKLVLVFLLCLVFGCGMAFAGPFMGYSNLDTLTSLGNNPSLTLNAASPSGPAQFPTMVVPEPGTLILLGTGLFGLGVIRRRRFK